jgi:hypothetical protein
MAGGLIQLVTSGKQDVALTYNPEITFFKKVYRRYTNFSLEIKEIYTDQQANFGDTISFTLSNADLIHRCFIQIEIPSLIFYDNNIINNNYIIWKNDLIQRTNNEISKWQNLYTNLKNYVSIELILYQQLLILFQSDNVMLNNLKESVTRFNNTYQIQINQYSNLIDIKIYNKINMSGYILSINSLLSYEQVAPNNNYITVLSIINNLNHQYNTMNEYLNYYHTNWQQNVKYYNNIVSTNGTSVNFAWTQFLGHYYFTNYQLEIGGQICDQYSSDQLHIYQLHHLQEEQINNYNIMIGNTQDLYEFNNNQKPSKIILVPLLFWFCKNQGASLPLVGMRNTSVSITLTINKLKNLIYFRDWSNEYNNLINITLPYTGILDTKLNYSTYNYDINSKNITYICNNINNEALLILYKTLNTNDINLILTTFGILENNIYVMYEINWINFKNNLSKYPSLIIKIGGYDTYIDYNYLLNLIPKPKLKLLAEFIFIDDVERNKFASSKLEYVIEGFQENVFDINNILLFNQDISIDRPNKYLKWFIQPKNFLIGITEYGKVTPYIFNYSKYYKNPIFDAQIITLNQLELLFENIDYSFYNLVSVYKCLNRSIDTNIFLYSFSLYPEETQPSGTANLSIIKEKKIRYELNNNFLLEYVNNGLNPNNLGLQVKVMSVSYNFFIVNHGIGRLIFTIS